jgi:hypothetical protein
VVGHDDVSQKQGTQAHARGPALLRGYTRTHTHAHTHAHTHTHTRARAHTHTHTHTFHAQDRPTGKLYLVREGDEISLCWVPSYEKYTKGSADVAHLSRYAFNRNIEEFYSFQRKENRLIAMLSIDGQPSSCLPPLIFEAGDRAVQDFLAVMQVRHQYRQEICCHAVFG